MNKIFTLAGVLLICASIFAMAYMWRIDHREAAHLSEYATIDFKVARDEDGSLEGANFFLWDYRFSNAQILPSVIFFIDDAPWELPATSKQTPPPSQYSYFRFENKLFASLPKSSLKSLLNAQSVRVKFFFDNGQVIDLPLSKKDLTAWRRKLRW